MKKGKKVHTHEQRPDRGRTAKSIMAVLPAAVRQHHLPAAL